MIDDISARLREVCRGELSDIAETAFRAAFKVGEVIRNLYGKEHRVEFKGEIDLVTEADYKSEEILKEVLSGIGAGEMMAEESATDLRLRDGRFWIVDPLDGTTNFAHGFPFFAPSVAYVRVDKGRFETLLGCVYIPILREFCWAVKGVGSFMNLERVSVSKEKELSRALLATGFPYDVHEKSDDVVDALKSIIVEAQGIRRAGAAAIDLAYVACGRFEGFWEKKLKPWDTAAGILLVEEAGGSITDFAGGSYNPFVPEIVASNGVIHDKMTDILKKYSCQYRDT